MSRTLLIDGDIPIFMYAAGAEEAICWGDPLKDPWQYWADPVQAAARLDAFMVQLQKDLDADRIVVALSDSRNFRYDVLPTYKHNRATTRQPMLRPLLKQYVEDNYEVFKRPGLEGDDVMGILSTSKQIIKGEKIIVSIDKDMQTIPGLLLNWDHARQSISEASEHLSFGDCIRRITPEEADRFHLVQALAGDPTDGYGGCPGVGVETAKRILEADPHILVETDHAFKSGKRKGETEKRWVKQQGDYTPWETIVSYYAKAGLSEEEALTQARVARICRNTDYDFKKREVILWEPQK